MSAAGFASCSVANSIRPVIAAGTAITAPATRHQKPVCHHTAAPVHAPSTSHAQVTDQSAIGTCTRTGCSGCPAKRAPVLTGRSSARAEEIHEQEYERQHSCTAADQHYTRR